MHHAVRSLSEVAINSVVIDIKEEDIITVED